MPLRHGASFPAGRPGEPATTAARASLHRHVGLTLRLHRCRQTLVGQACLPNAPSLTCARPSCMRREIRMHIVLDRAGIPVDQKLLGELRRVFPAIEGPIDDSLPLIRSRQRRRWWSRGREQPFMAIPRDPNDLGPQSVPVLSKQSVAVGVGSDTSLHLEAPRA